MFSWLVDHAGMISLFLGILALILASAWWMTRQRPYLYGLAGVLGLLALLWLLTRLIVTDRMQIVRTVDAMAQALQERKLDVFFQHVAGSFGHAGMNRQEFRQYVDSRLRIHKVTRFDVSKIVPEDVSRRAGTGKAEFWIQVEGNWEGACRRCVALRCLCSKPTSGGSTDSSCSWAIRVRSSGCRRAADEHQGDYQASD